MLESRLAASHDLPSWAVYVAVLLGVASLLFLLVELSRRRERSALWIAASGLLAVFALVCAVLRPVRIAARESVVGARVVVLADASRSMALPGDGGRKRYEDRSSAVREVSKASDNARISVLAFGDGPPTALVDGEAGAQERSSDLGAALKAIASSTEERPSAVVVVSDGRLDDSAEVGTTARELLGVPIHTIATTRRALPDASVRNVATPGAAIAHVPLPLKVEVGCTDALPCDNLTVTARELREDGSPSLLASGVARIQNGAATVDLTITLERAGSRVVEVAITPPSGDAIPENDRRLLTLHVARERVRILHVAGRPTYDVRALRQRLKSDASIDVVAFFILRTASDNAQASESDLALIPFPVDELFTDHLPSFDAVVLQDFDAQPYRLTRHLPSLARYVRGGGGLIMVGGPNSFVAGGYANTPLAEVLPVSLDGSSGATAADTATVTPLWTEEGRAAALLGPLRAVSDDELPPMPGANVLGDVRPGSIALWTHPSRTTRSGAPMPLLAVGDQGDGRAIALGLDGGWLFQFSALGAKTAGRGHGALWDGLLGWLMRDPRYEPAQLELPHGCLAGVPPTVRVRTSGGKKTDRLALELRRLDGKADPIKVERARGDGATVEFALPALPSGGYAAHLRLGTGPATRRDFACEAGGDEWADSRPDPERLQGLAKATGGTFSWADQVGRLPFPKASVISAERHVVPLAPPWLFALVAAALLGAHWLVRRRVGLA